MNVARVLLVGCLFVFAACSSTREVETSRPRAYEGLEDAEPENPRQARLRVFMEPGDTELPDDVDQLRFRTAEIRLRRADGEWVRLPSDAGVTEIERGRRIQPKLVLDTRIAPVQYDSLAISLSHVFVRFNENAGAPLTTAADAPQRLAIELEASLDEPVTVYLRLEPQPSLKRTQDCRWFFVPVFDTAVSREPARSP